MTRLSRFAAVLVVFAAFSTGLSASQDPATPVVPKERGIYLVQDGAAPAALTQARIEGSKVSSGGWKGALSSYALSANLASSKIKYQVRGVRADKRASEQPTFYLSGIEPNNLIVLTLKPKGKGQREYEAGSVKGYSGAMKAPEGDIQFTVEKVEGGYKLTFPAGLKAAEYGFVEMLPGVPMAAGVVYDFGVDAAISR